MEILGLKSFKATTDAQFVNLTMDMADAPPLDLQISTGTLASLLQQLAGIVWDTQKILPATRPRSIPLPVSARAQPLKEQRGVVVRFATENKLEYLFALDAQQSKAFGEEVMRSLDASPSK